VPVHFLGSDWRSSDAKWVAVALPIGMALGAISSGYLSDRLFRGNRSKVIQLFLALAALCSFAMYGVPRESALGVPLLFLCGFFAYGPQAAFWALCPDLLGRARAGTGTGVMNAFAYLFAGFGEPLIGWTIESNGDRTELVFLIVGGACILGALVSLGIRR
jgi:OPA family glycerol-3-phosphate transporter-like MFS transporter